MPASVFMLMVSVGMGLEPARLMTNWRSLTAATWIKLLLGTFWIPAAAALLLARLFGLTLADTAGLFLVGAAPGAPLVTRNVVKKGFDLHLAASYQIWGALLTPVMVPVIVAAAGALYERNIWVPPQVLLWQIVRFQFVPLLVGMSIARIAPAMSLKLGKVLNILGNVLLSVMIILILYKLGPELLKLSPGLAVAALLLAFCSLGVMLGFARGQSQLGATHALVNLNRHIGLALLMNGQYLHAPAAVPAIASYALASPLVMTLYVRLFHRDAAAAR